MSNIKKEIESLRAKIARLEAEQKKAEVVNKALSSASSQIDKILKDNGINLETYIRHNYKEDCGPSRRDKGQNKTLDKEEARAQGSAQQ